MLANTRHWAGTEIITGIHSLPIYLPSVTLFKNVRFSIMKLFLHFLIVATMCGVSACGVNGGKSAHLTSSGRAAYGNAAPEFKANKKKNQKRKKMAGRQAKRKRATDNRLYFHRRPY